MKNYDLYPHRRINTLKEMLSFCTDSYGDKPAFQYAKRKIEISVNFTQFKAEVESLGAYLFSLGLKDCHIAVFGENSYEWILSYFSVVCGRNVIVPIDKDLCAGDVALLLNDSKCRAVVYSQTYSDIIAEVQNKEMSHIEFISMETIPELIEEGNRLPGNIHSEYEGIEIAPDDLASIVYTSGTTGRSKGVMLSHKNLSADTFASCCSVQLVGPSILVLPLHHTFGLVAGVFAAMFYGLPVYINKSLKNLLSDFQKCKPNHLFVVPLVVETLYKNIWIAARKQGKERALKLLIKVSDTLLKIGIDLRRTLFKSVLVAFGGELELIVSGGAPLDEKYVAAYRSFGITLLNGYGITECGPVVAVNRNKFNVVGSVGMPICSNHVKIGGDGEILVKGDNVSPGYYNDPKTNNLAFTDGWFRTGDLGYMDEFGALHITGRIKNLIILSNGENISAESIEKLVYTLSYVKEVVAYGQDDVIVAEVFLDADVPDAKGRIHDDIKAINQRLPLVRNIGKVVIRDTEFPKTTTKKIKRKYGGK